MRTQCYRQTIWLVGLCMILPGMLSNAVERGCGVPTPGPVCPEADHPPCNDTDILAQIASYEDVGAAGSGTSVWCPVLTYPSCPQGLRQSDAEDTEPETFFERMNGAGSVYILDLAPEGPKACYVNVPCAQVPEISTIPNEENCYPCLVGLTVGFDPELSNPEPNGLDVCGNYAWCVPVESPPEHVLTYTYSSSWDKVVFDQECKNIHGL